MPTYTFRNKETQEEKEFILSLSEREEMIKQGEWEQMLSRPLLVSQVGSTLGKTSDGWKEHLRRVKKVSGKDNTINT